MSEEKLVSSQTDKQNAARQAYHLTPAEVWDRQRNRQTYVPETFQQDGFIHTTIGLQPLLVVANTFYREDSRPYVALILDLDAVQADVRHDDSSGIYPHIYGLLNLDAVVGSLAVRRARSGQFLGFDQTE